VGEAVNGRQEIICDNLRDQRDTKKSPADFADLRRSFTFYGFTSIGLPKPIFSSGLS
jgi:hypothetical protein